MIVCSIRVHNGINSGGASVDMQFRPDGCSQPCVSSEGFLSFIPPS
jgi:hypothetical protein